VGPFITQVRLKLPDGTPFVWNSRKRRFTGGGQRVPSQKDEQGDDFRWWHSAWLFVRIIWWISAFFVIGSACFAIASAAGLAPRLFGAFGNSPVAINSVFFVGSIFFTTAAYFQFVAAVNSDRISSIVNRTPPQQRFRWFALKWRDIGWISAFIQLTGTILFNINTFDALLPGLDWLQEDLIVWAPDAVGATCFLLASGVAFVEYGEGSLVWRPRDVSWWIVNVNMLGSIAFGFACIYAFVVPDTGDLISARAVNAWTMLGAVCFLVGAYLLLPEVARNLRNVTAQREFE